MRIVSFALAALVIAAAFAAAFWPQLDLIASGLFYTPGQGFTLANQPVFEFLHWLAVKGAWALGVALALLALLAGLRKKPVLGIGSKGWLFLFLALMLGPVLTANAILKDHWGRARPREVTEFGGTFPFTPALEPQHAIRTNGSFVAGDGAFGFFLPSFAYIVPRRRNLSRRVFWGGMGAGAVFGFTRLAMGAHFLSDVVFAALFMLLVSAALHAAMFGGRETRGFWREWFGNEAAH